MRVGCAVLALTGGMYAAAGLMVGPLDVVFGLAVAAIGLGGLWLAKYWGGKG